MRDDVKPTVRLMAERAAQTMINEAKAADPNNMVGQVAGQIGSEAFFRHMAEASKWAFDAIRVLRSAPDATFADDEEAAAAILDRIKERRDAQREELRLKLRRRIQGSLTWGE